MELCPELYVTVMLIVNFKKGFFTQKYFYYKNEILVKFYLILQNLLNNVKVALREQMKNVQV